jgi:hypothetical protein
MPYSFAAKLEKALCLPSWIISKTDSIRLQSN